MRIVNEWNHRNWKYTLFHHQMKHSLKVENGTTEQWYKLYDIDAEQIPAIKSYTLSPLMLQKIAKHFAMLDETRSDILSEIHGGGEEEEFEDII